MSAQLKRRLRAGVPSIILALTVYVPLFLTRPGRVGADTKTYLYLDPSRLLSRATSMWDPSIGLGTVTHQNIGFLWPIGPYYWLAETLGVPDWIAQRFWTGSILFLAGLGVRFMLRTMGQEGPHVTAATFCYALTPYVLTLSARLSVILLPYAGLPWLLGLTVLALRRRRWREPALFALVVASIGSAHDMLLVGPRIVSVGVGMTRIVGDRTSVTRWRIVPSGSRRSWVAVTPHSWRCQLMCGQISSLGSNWWPLIALWRMNTWYGSIEFSCVWNQLHGASVGPPNAK